jgi:stage II sporulation protein D
VPSPMVMDNFVRYKQKKYRGILELVWNRSGTISVVNVLPLEEYLRGVVPGEMPASWPAEALKAQAVAARTYARYQMGGTKYAAEGFDVDDTTASQVYGGVLSEDARTDAAIAATAGQYITYQGKIIPAFFFAASGGYTENNEYVFTGGSPLPYLRGVPDFDQGSSRYAWSYPFVMTDIAARLAEKNILLGTLYDISPVGPTGPSGRPTRWRVVGSLGVAELTMEEMRWWMGMPAHVDRVIADETAVQPVTVTYKDGASVTVLTAGGVQQVNLKDVTVLSAGGAVTTVSGATTMTAPQTVMTKVTMTGGGWGHRVGLSQWGARGMALLDKTYVQILQHYYQGTQVMTLP